MSYNRICISSGHGKYIRGASGSPVPPQLDEVNEARKVVEKIADELRARDVEVMTFHDDTSRDQSTNLSTIVSWHNSKTGDLDVSVHFNAYDGHAHGTEVLYVTQQSLAGKLSSAIAACGFTNRGAKYRGDLYFLNNTEKPAVLLEVCFCDNTSDSGIYRDQFDDICDSIADVLGGKQGVEPEPEPPPEIVDEAIAEVGIQIKGNVTLIVNGETITYNKG